MMALDIENLTGADADAFRAVIASYAGHALVSNHVVSTPESYVEIALPSGYSQFELRISGLMFSDDEEDWLVAALKLGSTWLNDTDNSDSYVNLCKKYECGGDGSSASEAVAGFMEPVMALLQGNGGADPAFPSHCNVTIYPGSATLAPRLRSSGIFKATNHFFVDSLLWVNPYATVPPTLARATAIRILPLGDSNVNPPTSETTIEAGTFTLFGVPE